MGEEPHRGIQPHTDSVVIEDAGSRAHTHTHTHTHARTHDDTHTHTQGGTHAGTRSLIIRSLYVCLYSSNFIAEMEEGKGKKRVTTPYMTKFERARVLGTRALQVLYSLDLTVGLPLSGYIVIPLSPLSLYEKAQRSAHAHMQSAPRNKHTRTQQPHTRTHAPNTHTHTHTHTHTQVSMNAPVQINVGNESDPLRIAMKVSFLRTNTSCPSN
jgi:DNA-directed RNA polymerase subunit K/omega